MPKQVADVKIICIFSTLSQAGCVTLGQILTGCVTLGQILTGCVTLGQILTG